MKVAIINVYKRTSYKERLKESQLLSLRKLRENRTVPFKSKEHSSRKEENTSLPTE